MAASTAPAAAFKLPAIVSSPTTLLHARHKLRTSPFYTPGFKMTKEQWKETLAAPWFRYTDPLMPRYPYGKNVHFPEANYGLYGGATISSGSKISKGRNKGKTMRKWLPNIKLVRIESKALGRELTLPIRARVIRTIKKCGGLDEYLLGERPARIKELGPLGWKLRWMILQTPAVSKQVVKRLKKLGLSATDPNKETFEEVWNDERRRNVLLKQQDAAWERLRKKMENYEEHVARQWGKSDNNEEGYADFFAMRRGTLSDRVPSKMTLPERIEAMTIQDRRPKPVQQADPKPIS
jgi:ribosomal protein L28